MQLKYGVISADDHVQEHPDVWTTRMSRARWGDRAPHVERGGDGAERWLVDGAPLTHLGISLAGGAMADRAREPLAWADVPAVACSPAARLGAMDVDGVDGSVLYPTVAGFSGEAFARLVDPELELACVQSYNDWLIDEWAAMSNRFIPLCLVPSFPAEAAVKEIERAVGRGHRGVIYPAAPMELRELPHVNEPDYDPIWAACGALGVPLCIHAGSSGARVPAGLELANPVRGALDAVTRSAGQMGVIVQMLISRILMRHPDLRVVFAESTFGVANQLEFVDQQAREDRIAREGYDLPPSELFHRQCFVTGWYGAASIRTRHLIGVKNMLWSTNFPLADTSWPGTRDHIVRALDGIPDAEREQILWRNSAELYGVPIERQ